jgi:hypothetical protein
MKTLLQISAFYQNDKPNGIGVTLTDELPLDTIFHEITHNYDAMWRQSVFESETSQLTKDLFAQLEFIGRNKKPLGMEMALMTIGNIYLLEKVGALVDDEYNGLQLIYRSKK